MPCLSDPGPLNVRRPHPHKEQPTEAGCRNVEPNRKEDHGKDRMYRGAELAAAPRTGGTPLRPCPTSGTPFDATAGRRVIGQRRGVPGAEHHQSPNARCRATGTGGRFPSRYLATACCFIPNRGSERRLTAIFGRQPASFRFDGGWTETVESDSSRIESTNENRFTLLCCGKPDLSQHFFEMRADYASD